MTARATLREICGQLFNVGSHSGYCKLDPDHEGDHSDDLPVPPEPPVLTEVPLQARRSDPQSSRQFAESQFGSRGQQEEILALLYANLRQWFTCEEMALALYAWTGTREMTWQEFEALGVRINKLQTNAKKLFDDHRIRREVTGSRIRYRMFP